MAGAEGGAPPGLPAGGAGAGGRGAGAGIKARLTVSRLNKPIELTEEDVLEVQAQAPPTTNFSRILADGHREERPNGRPGASARKAERTGAARRALPGEHSPQGGGLEDTSPKASPQQSPLSRLPPRLQKLLGEVPAPVRYSLTQRTPPSLVPRGSPRDPQLATSPPAAARGSPGSATTGSPTSPAVAAAPSRGGSEPSPGSEGSPSEYSGGAAGAYPSSSNIPRASVGKIVMTQRPVERGRPAEWDGPGGGAGAAAGREASGAEAKVQLGAGVSAGLTKDAGPGGRHAVGAPGIRGGGRAKKERPEERQSDLGLYSGSIAGWDEPVAPAGGTGNLDLGGLPIASSDWN